MQWLAKRYCFLMLVVLWLPTKAQLVYPHLRLVADSAWTFKNLRLIPIRFTDSAIFDAALQKPFVLLEQAMAQKKVLIKENNFEGHADIAVLTIQNLAQQNILVLNGELLKGGKQDRMIGQTQIVVPGKELDYLSVFCVEKGRWDKKPQPFVYAGVASNALRKAADSLGTQQHIWKEIEQQFQAEKMSSNTYPYLQLQQKQQGADTAYINFFTQRFAKSDSSYAGFIAVTDSAIIGCDLFATPQLTAAAYGKILQSYVQAVKNKQAKVKDCNTKVQQFASKLLQNEAVQKKYLEKHGKLFLYNNKPVHLVAFGGN